MMPHDHLSSLPPGSVPGRRWLALSTGRLIFAAAATLVLGLAGPLPSAQPPQREVKWNYPEGPKGPGLEHGSFRSQSMEFEVGYSVYLPDGYAQGKGRYPVIYFLHGAGGNENSDAGGFSGLVRRLTAARKMTPAICVFPNGGMSGYQDRPAAKVMGETLLIKELIPLIDRTYRTQTNREGRVLAGFSMGGGGAVRLSLKYPDLFSAAAAWAGALQPRGGNPPPELQPEYLKNLSGQVRLVRLLLIVGDKDITFAGHKPVVEAMEQAKYPVRYKVLEGVAHNLGLYYEKTGEELVTFLTEKFQADQATATGPKTN
jgi:enterochelin esterase-like enzyme